MLGIPYAIFLKTIGRFGASGGIPSGLQVTYIGVQVTHMGVDVTHNPI